MDKDVKRTKRILDMIRLVVAVMAVGFLIGALVYQRTDRVFPVDVNLVMGFMISIYVFCTGAEQYARNIRRNIAVFLMYCSFLILVINLIVAFMF